MTRSTPANSTGPCKGSSDDDHGSKRILPAVRWQRVDRIAVRAEEMPSLQGDWVDSG